MAKINVTDRDGNTSELEAPAGSVLMETLRDGDTGVLGTCGGMCSCGTCHVYIDPAWAERTGARNPDEDMMLEALVDFVEVRPNSRLACQIAVDESLDGLAVEVAPEA